MRKSNFTLIELIAVVAIMAILLSTVMALRSSGDNRQVVKVCGFMKEVQLRSYKLKMHQWYKIELKSRSFTDDDGTVVGVVVEVTDEKGRAVDSFRAKGKLEFAGASGRTFRYHWHGYREEPESISFMFTIDGYKAKINTFNGNIEYYW